MLNSFIILLGKTISKISSTFNLGSGSTWPGHIALSLNKNFIKDIFNKPSRPKTVLIAGTNGKTTTSKLIRTILEQNGKKVFQNESGANLLNGIASSLLLHDVSKYDYAIFEIDENTLPLALKEFTPDYIILLNLFRDQLDRYGEVNTIALKWKEALSVPTTLILNADDPLIASLCQNCHSELGSESPRVYYFGLNEKSLVQTKPQHASDSTYCPNCETKLSYKSIYFSHLGDWECKNCKLKRPEVEDLKIKAYPLSGVYNQYNTNAAVLFAKISNVNNETIQQSLKNFSPAFGRQEIIEINGKKVQLSLSKNPTSFNQSLQTVVDLGANSILFVLNDRVPDGRDISWIWDVDFEEYLNESMNISVSGDRACDIALRIKYTDQFKIKNLKFKIEENLKIAISKALNQTPKSETLYILPTYSAMLETRKILTGKKIL